MFTCKKARSFGFIIRILFVVLILQTMSLILQYEQHHQSQDTSSLFCRCIQSYTVGEANAAEPIADAGNDVTVVKDMVLGSEVQLDGTRSSDADGDALRYGWYGPFPEADGSSPEVYVPEGSYTASLIASDQTSRLPADSILINVTSCFSITARAKAGLVQLVWTNIEGTDRYDVYRCHESDPADFQKIAETTSTYSTHLDDTITNENTYLYVVGALSGL